MSLYHKLTYHVLKSFGNITKFEKAKMIGARAQQLAAGATPRVEVRNSVTDVVKIAESEFAKKKIPMMIRRKLTNGQYEDWRLNDFNY